MQFRHKLALATAVTIAAPVLVVLVAPRRQAATGPCPTRRSRSYTCWQEGPESPDSAACRAAVAAGGTQAFYDWHEVSLLDGGRAAPRDHPRRQAVRRRPGQVPRSRPRRGPTGRPPGSRRATSPSPTTPPRPTRTATSSSTSPARAGARPSRCAGRTWSTSERSPTRTRPRSPTGPSPPPADRPAHPLLDLAARGRQRRGLLHLLRCGLRRRHQPPPPPPPPTQPAAATPAHPPPTAAAARRAAPGRAGVTYAIGARVTYGGMTYQCRQAHTRCPAGSRRTCRPSGCASDPSHGGGRVRPARPRPPSSEDLPMRRTVARGGPVRARFTGCVRPGRRSRQRRSPRPGPARPGSMRPT